LYEGSISSSDFDLIAISRIFYEGYVVSGTDSTTICGSDRFQSILHGLAVYRTMASFQAYQAWFQSDQVALSQLGVGDSGCPNSQTGTLENKTVASDASAGMLPYNGHR
jgi:hypothetical protein